MDCGQIRWPRTAMRKHLSPETWALGAKGQTAQKAVKFLLRLLKLDPERIKISLYGQQNQYSVEEVGRKGERVRASWHPPDVALCRMKY